MGLVAFNDRCRGIAELRAVIHKARAGALENAEHERAAAALKSRLLAQVEHERAAARPRATIGKLIFCVPARPTKGSRSSAVSPEQRGLSAHCADDRCGPRGRRRLSEGEISNHAPASQPLFASAMARPVARRRADAAAQPQWIRPQLTQLVAAAPDDEGWLHEIKYDGYRMHARLDRGAVKLLTRTGLDWTQKYPAIAPRSSPRSLPARPISTANCAACGPDGITSFS